eukprot:2471945-Pleurochrysis_carterae.AAC.3
MKRSETGLKQQHITPLCMTYPNFLHSVSIAHRKHSHTSATAQRRCTSRRSKVVRGLSRSSRRTLKDHARLSQAGSTGVTTIQASGKVLINTSTSRYWHWELAQARGWTRLRAVACRGRRGAATTMRTRSTGNLERRGRARATYTSDASGKTARFHAKRNGGARYGICLNVRRAKVKKRFRWDILRYASNSVGGNYAT